MWVSSGLPSCVGSLPYQGSDPPTHSSCVFCAFHTLNAHELRRLLYQPAFCRDTEPMAKCTEWPRFIAGDGFLGICGLACQGGLSVLLAVLM